MFFFSMNNKQWFDKIFKSDSYGVTVDIVTKDRYACSLKTDQQFALPKGTMLLPQIFLDHNLNARFQSQGCFMSPLKYPFHIK